MSAQKPPAEATKDPPAKRRTGAPLGNVNAARDPKFTRAMREAQEAARRGRRKRLREAEAIAREIVREAGLSESPLGARLAARLAEVEHEIAELRGIVERVGRTRRDGTLGNVYEKLLQLIREDRTEIRALVDRLAEVMAAARAAGERDVVYEVKLGDGREVPASALGLAGVDEEAPPDAPPAPGEAEAASDEPSPVEEPAGSPEPVQRVERRASHPIGCGCSRCQRKENWLQW